MSLINILKKCDELPRELRLTELFRVIRAFRQELDARDPVHQISAIEWAFENCHDALALMYAIEENKVLRICPMNVHFFNGERDDAFLLNRVLPEILGAISQMKLGCMRELMHQARAIDLHARDGRLNDRDAQFNASALHGSAWWRCEGSLMLLLATDIDVNGLNNFNANPLLLACCELAVVSELNFNNIHALYVHGARDNMLNVHNTTARQFLEQSFGILAGLVLEPASADNLAAFDRKREDLSRTLLTHKRWLLMQRMEAMTAVASAKMRNAPGSNPNHALRVELINLRIMSHMVKDNIAAGARLYPDVYPADAPAQYAMALKAAKHALKLTAKS